MEGNPLGGLIQTMVSSAVTIVVYGLIVAGVYKIFQVAADLSEIKDLLRDIKRNTQDTLVPGVRQSPEDLLRAVGAESYPPESTTAPGAFEPR
jgi:hypothetical protein